MEKYKSVEKYLLHQTKNQSREKLNQRKKNLKSNLLSFINRTLLSGILLLTVLCMIKMNPETKDVIYKNVYSKNISFAPFREWYEKYFGNLFPEELSKKLPKDQMVFEETFVYQKKEEIKNGVRLSVGKGYLVPALESGIIVFMGEKEEYGNTLIIQQMNGVDAWYVGMNLTELKLYDYIEKGSLLGEAKEKELDLYFQKEGEFVNYQDYIS